MDSPNRDDVFWIWVLIALFWITGIACYFAGRADYARSVTPQTTTVEKK